MNIVRNLYNYSEQDAMRMAKDNWDMGIRFTTDVNPDGDFVISQDGEQDEPYKLFVTEKVTEVVNDLLDSRVECNEAILKTMWRWIDKKYKFFSTFVDIITDIITMQKMKDIIYTERVIFNTNDLIWDFDDKEAEEFNHAYTFIVAMMLADYHQIYGMTPFSEEKKIEALKDLGLDPYKVLRKD